MHLCIYIFNHTHLLIYTRTKTWFFVSILAYWICLKFKNDINPHQVNIKFFTFFSCIFLESFNHLSFSLRYLCQRTHQCIISLLLVPKKDTTQHNPVITCSLEYIAFPVLKSVCCPNSQKQAFHCTDSQSLAQ